MSLPARTDTIEALNSVLKQVHRNLNQQLYELDRSGMATGLTRMWLDAYDYKSDRAPNDLMKELCGC